MHRGYPDNAATAGAVDDAIRRIRTYKGRPNLTPTAREFVQAVTLDVLPAAPQPVTPDWVNYTLTCLGGLVRWIATTGQPLTREHVLSERVIARYVHVIIGDRVGGTRAGYIARLETIAGLLLSRAPGDATITQEPPVTPLTLHEEADLWNWARGMSTTSRRQFFKAVLALGLGAGLFRYEIGNLRPEHVHLDADGAVHVSTFRKRTKEARVVTCRADWEARLATVVNDCPAGHMVATPWRTEPFASGLTARLTTGIAMEHPPAPFNTHRLRNTWIAHQMESGAPLTVLMAGSGLHRMCSLEEMLPNTRVPDPGTVAAMLRYGWGRS